ncbi:MAG: carbonic anhydrase [Pseudomonadota bacterium]
MYKHPLNNREKITPTEALDILLEGNERFITNQTETKDFKGLLSIVTEQQRPFAAFLSCADSRAPVELIFDQALGDIFSVRLAGNIASDKAIGSLEYSTKHLGSKLIVVMGHTACGAVKAACDEYREGHIGEIVNMIRPCIRFEKEEVEDRSSNNKDFVDKVVKLNVQYQIDTIIRCSDLIDQQLRNKEIGIIGGVFNFKTGKVDFLEETLTT